MGSAHRGRRPCHASIFSAREARLNTACKQGSYRAVGEQLSLLEVSGIERVAGVLKLLGASLLDTPLAHHKGIVDGEAVDLIDAARLDTLVVLLVTGQVGRGAGGCERAGQGKDHDALALHEVLGGDILPRERVVAADGLVADTALESDLRARAIRLYCASRTIDRWFPLSGGTGGWQ
jgi:hypothetical protein